MGASLSDFNYRAVLAPSRLGMALVLGGGCGTLALVVSLPLVAEMKAAAVLWIGMNWLRAFRIAAGRREVLVWDTHIDVRDGREGLKAGRLVDGSFVTPWLTSIRWRPAGDRFDRSILILPGVLDAESFRQLRVLLKTGDRSLVPPPRTLGTDRHY